MNFGQIHHLEYYVKDLNRSNDFWNWFMPFMGYVKFQEWSEGISWQHQSGTYIVFVQLSEASQKINNNRHGSGLNHIAFSGKDKEHFEELKLELNKRNFKILILKDDYICIEDYNDFAIEVFLH